MIIGNNQNQIPQQFAGSLPNNTTPNYGGYPYGYPPAYPQGVGCGVPGMNYQNQFVSPFQQQAPQANPAFGFSAPLEVTNKDGSTVVIPPPQPSNQCYNQGGTMVSQGGFNPAAGTISQPVAAQGFNPYTKFIGNPGYQYQPTQQQQQGFSPYYPGCYQQSNGQYIHPNYGYYGYGYNNGQNEFNVELQNALYEQEPSAIDTKAMLEQVMLSDEEREKINHNRTYQVGVDYYGRPIYNNGNYYQANQQKQQELEQSRHAWQAHFTMLSKIAHGYYGEQIDEDSAMKFFDPIPQQQVNSQKLFNFYNSTPEEKKAYERKARIQAVYDLDQKAQRYDMIQNQLDAQKQAAYAAIKASHDRLIGVEPGQHYDLKTFMDNGYKLGVNIAMKQAKSANRNGTTKYSRNDYRANLSTINNSPVPITSKDDEYVSIEEMVKSVYDRNKLNFTSILKNQSGQVTYTGEPTFPSELEAHKYFLQAMQQKKDKDDLRRAVL